MQDKLPFVPEGILIDFYGTLAAGDREAVESTCRGIVEVCGLPISPADFAVRWGERYFATVGRSNHEAFRTLYECETSSLAATLAEFGERRDPLPFLTELESYWSDPPLHADAVEFLQSANRPLCCVSNADTRPLLAAIRKYDLRFDAVISSEAVRCYKPEKLIFQEALDRLGIAANRAIHIGDSLHSDIAGADALGITTVWLCRENRIHDIGNHHPNFTIDSLSALMRLLDT